MLSRLYAFLIHPKIIENAYERYIHKMFVNALVILFLVMGLSILLESLGVFYNPGPLGFFLFAITFAIIVNRRTGNLEIASNSILLLTIAVVVLIIDETGGIYSYNLRWFNCILIVSYLFSHSRKSVAIIPVTFTLIGTGIVIYFYFVSLTPQNDTDFLADKLEFNSLDYAIDNLLFIVTVALLAYFIQKTQTKLMNLYQEENQNLKKANIELERFAYISSHDLKEPLRNIIAFSQLISEGVSQKEFAQLETYANIVHNNAKQMNELIIETLEFALIDKNTGERQEVDLNQVVKKVESLLQDPIQQKNATIQVTHPLPTVLAREGEMLLCVKNLVENGLKYNEQPHPSIRIDHSLEPEQVVVSISDNGNGIPSDQFDKIFEMYSRLVNRTQYQGTGLGLSICKKIIDRIGGKIWVESEIGKGSTFYFSVPR